MSITRRSRLRAFICYASEDKAAVIELRERLNAEGFDTWLDKDRLLPGHDWRLEIRRAIRTVDVVLVCLSTTAVTKAGYLQKEIRDALDIADEQPEGRIFLIPLRLDACEVPDRLRGWHWVDLFETGGFDSLVRALDSRILVRPNSTAEQRNRDASTSSADRRGLASGAHGDQFPVDELKELIRQVDDRISSLDRAVGKSPRPKLGTEIVFYAVLWAAVSGILSMLTVVLGFQRAAFAKVWIAMLGMLGLGFALRLRMYVLHERVDRLKDRRRHLLDCLVVREHPRPDIAPIDSASMWRSMLDVVRTQRRALWIALLAFAVFIVASFARVVLLDHVPDLALRSLELVHPSPRSLALHPTASYMAIGGDGSEIELVDYVAGMPKAQSLVFAPRVRGLAFTPNGDYLIAAGGANLGVWDMQWHSKLTKQLNGVLVASISVSPDSTLIALAASGNVLLVDIDSARTIRCASRGHDLPVIFSSGGESHVIAGGELLTAVGFSVDGAYVIAASKRGSVYLWDARSGAFVRELVSELAIGYVHSLLSLADGEHVAIGGDDIAIVRLSDGAVTRQLQGHSDSVLILAQSPDGMQLASAGSDGTVRLWNLSSAMCTRVLTGHKGEITGLAFIDNEMLVTVGLDGRARWWSTNE